MAGDPRVAVLARLISDDECRDASWDGKVSTGVMQSTWDGKAQWLRETYYETARRYLRVVDAVRDPSPRPSVPSTKEPTDHA